MAQGLKTGTTLRSGSYRIERILGQGGFGITYVATDLTLDRLVAIKEFFPADYCDREGDTSHVTLGTKNTAQFVNKLKAKFLKEAKNIAKFDHPGIIKIHAAFEENNTAYYVMDFIEGESLSARVKRDGPLPQDVALRYINEVGKALEYVHSKQMNHLDVKPANIMIRRRDDRPILIDFGLSKQYDTEGNQTSTTPTGISHGYAPMEQYNDGGVRSFSPQTDLYSLAATLYYLLSGIVPPQATRLIESALAFPPSIPAYLIPPIKKAMASARFNRHSTVREFLDEINGEGETEIVAEVISATPRPKTVSAGTPNPPAGPKPTTTGSDRTGGPTPPSGQKPAAFTGYQPESPVSKQGGNKKWFIIGAVAAAVIVFAVVMLKRGSSSATVSSDSLAESSTVATEPVAETVEGMYYKSSLGACSYTGEVDQNGLPHGKGKAVWESGLGREYDGGWNHGQMDGECVYLNRDGYRFEGKFKADHYYEGKLTGPDGTYYEGTFDKDGNKWNGTEYDANGTATATWKDGE